MNGQNVGFFTFSDSSWTDSYVYLGSRQIAWLAQANEFFTHFIHASVAGSTTQVTDQAGNLGLGISGHTEGLVWYPFGQEWTNSGSWNDTIFGGMEPYQRNFGLNPTPNRLQSPVLGRWMSPDPLGGDVTDPQSLNRYAYVLNNPTTLTDPLGLKTCGGNGPKIPNGSDPLSWCKTHMGVWAGSNPLGFFSNNADEFDLLGPTFTSYKYGSETGLVEVGITNGPEVANWLNDNPGLSGGGSSLAWWGTFAKNFVMNFSLKGGRLPGETLNQCVNRVQDAVFTPKGAKVLAAFSLGSLIPAWGTTSVGTATKAVNIGGNLWTWEKVPAAPILESTPAWASTAIGVPTAVAWGLELGSLAACHP